jgi:hypothetical protein
VAEDRPRPARRRQQDAQKDESSDEQPEEKGDSSEDTSMQVKKDEGTRTDTTATLEPLTEASAQDWLGSNQDPDVLLSIPNLGVDHIGITVDNIKAHVELHAQVLDLLELHVGAQVSIEKVEINIENVRVQAMLKVRLNEVYKIVDRVMTTIDNNPEILTNLTQGLGKGLEKGLSGGTSSSGDDDRGGGESLDKSIEGSTNVEKDEEGTDQDA